MVIKVTYTHDHHKLYIRHVFKKHGVFQFIVVAETKKISVLYFAFLFVIVGISQLNFKVIHFFLL